MPTILQTFRHLQRYQQIGRILTRYGFGYVLTQLGIGRAITPGLERLRFSSSESMPSVFFSFRSKRATGE